jgi:transposase-like protein
MKQLTKALVQRTMEAELTEHPGYEKHDQREKPQRNRRNGKSVKALRSSRGPMTVEVPPELISGETDEVKEPAAEWRGRALEPFYPVLFLDALRVNIHNGAAVKKSVY